MKIFDWFKSKVTNKECIWQTYKIVTLYTEKYIDCGSTVYDIEVRLEKYYTIIKLLENNMGGRKFEIVKTTYPKNIKCTLEKQMEHIYYWQAGEITKMNELKLPPCPPPPSRVFVDSFWGFSESKESIKKRENYMNKNEEDVEHDDINSTVVQINKLLDKHIKWLHNLPIPTQGCLYQITHVIGEAQRLLNSIKNNGEHN